MTSSNPFAQANTTTTTNQSVQKGHTTMSTNNTQAQLRSQARAQLAIIGGALVKDQDAVYEGRRFVFPEQYKGDGQGLVRDVHAYVMGEEEEVLVDKTFDY